MKKKSSIKKLGKPADQRNALIRSQVKDLLERGHIKTTKARAHAVERKVDALMSYVVSQNEKSLGEYLANKDLTKKVLSFNVDGKISGFTSARKVKTRPGDNSELVLLELLVK